MFHKYISHKNGCILYQAINYVKFEYCKQDKTFKDKGGLFSEEIRVSKLLNKVVLQTVNFDSFLAIYFDFFSLKIPLLDHAASFDLNGLKNDTRKYFE